MFTLSYRSALGFLRRYKRGAFRHVHTTLFTEDGPQLRTSWIDVKLPRVVLEVSEVKPMRTGAGGVVKFTDGQSKSIRQFYNGVHDGTLILVGATPDYVPTALYVK